MDAGELKAQARSVLSALASARAIHASSSESSPREVLSAFLPSLLSRCACLSQSFSVAFVSFVQKTRERERERGREREEGRRV